MRAGNRESGIGIRVGWAKRSVPTRFPGASPRWAGETSPPYDYDYAAAIAFPIPGSQGDR